MKSTSAAFQNALRYSHRPVDRVAVWRDGRELVPELRINAGTLSISGGDTQAVVMKLDLVVSDKDGKLIPYSASDPLAPFGSELVVHMGHEVGMNPEWVRMATCVLTDTEIDETVGTLDAKGMPDDLLYYSRGAKLTLSASDRTLNIMDDKFINAESPVGPTVFDETRRLLIQGRPPFGGAIGPVGDRSVSTTITYDGDRLKAILELGDSINSDVLMDEFGRLKYRARNIYDIVHRFEKGKFSVLRNTKRKLSRTGVYNAAVEKGQTEDQVPLVATRFIQDGPLAWSGPFGRVSLQHASTLLNTQQHVEAGVESVFARAQRIDPQAVPIQCTRNVALEWGDWVELPRRSSGYVQAQIRGLTFRMGSSLMDLVVAADPFQLRDVL